MAYCNDKWLMVQSDGTPGNVFTPNMNDTPFPPGGSCDGSTCRTGMDTLDTSKSDTIYFPLNVEDLSTSTATNNIGVFDCGANGGSGTPATDASGSTCQNPLTHLYDPSTSTSFGIPADAGIGMGVNGQSIFPVCESSLTLSHRRSPPPIADTFCPIPADNNHAGYTPDKCEVDSCQEHVGQGGGQPHFHGDPFGDQDSSSSSPNKCLYGPSNYTSGVTGHPPLIGFAFDGHLIYGRYLSAAAPGFAAPLLDACGGHSHSSSSDVDENGISLGDYHYHTQVFDRTCPSGGMCVAGEVYKVSTTGPYNCFKANLAGALMHVLGPGGVTLFNSISLIHPGWSQHPSPKARVRSWRHR